MLPPTRSRASVTKKEFTESECFVLSARAVTRPDMPAPTTTTSYTVDSFELTSYIDAEIDVALHLSTPVRQERRRAGCPLPWSRLTCT
jgi:hypothetical protein